MRFKTHFSRRKSASCITSLPASRRGSVTVSIVTDPSTHIINPKMSGRESTISMSDASFGLRSDRDTPVRYVRRPNLAQILADESMPPWTLEAFTAYAARNLCLENIEFIQDARRYKAAYRAFIGLYEGYHQNSRPSINRANSAQVELLKEMWTRLIINYIAPSSPREINLTADIRSGLLPHNKQVMPPSPALLDPAIKKIEELIEDSILFSFLNEVQSSVDPSLYQSSVTSQERLALDTGFHSAEKLTSPSSVHEMISPTSEPVTTSPFTPSTRSPRHSHYAASHGGSSSHKGSTASNTHNGHMIGSAANSIAPTLSEDSSSVISPTASQYEQRTPPHTPPATETEVKRSSKQNDRWKRMSQRFGLGRRGGTALKDVQEDHSPLP